MSVRVLYREKEREMEPGISMTDAVKAFDKKLARKAIVARIDGKLVDMNTPITQDVDIEILTADTPEGLEILRHSTSHIMAAAVKRLFPDVQVTIGPSIENGFYYDFDRDEPFTPEDLPKIEKEIKKIIKENHSFEKQILTVDDAIKMFRDMGETYKVELIEDLVKNEKVETVSVYKSGDFVDLCRGPHIPSTSKIKSYKLLDVAGAYWRGDEKNKMLQRIYGTAFNNKEELDQHLKNLAEAKRRDHRKLGKELDLFSFQDDGGPGLAYWHPNGGLIRHIIETFWKEEHLKREYDLVYTPHIARAHLWETSGHLDFYRENMYSPLEIDGQEYILKPMNCPFHILIYKTKIHSYRDLPLRWAELGTVYRYERSGVLHGLLRVRGFTQDDAHIFCTPDQLKEEMINCVKFAIFIIESFGFSEYDIFLATRPVKFAGTSQEWDTAEDTLRKALNEQELPFTIDEGGAVFYGPKIDIKLKDALGRHWQGPTIQFDFNLSKKFDVNYIGADGQEHRCFMVHRALMGSLERFFGCLVEHYGGAFPAWLSPVQVMVLPIADRHIEYADQVAKQLKNENFRAKVDKRREKTGFKIREAQIQKVPYMLIIGDNEIEEQKIAVRERKQGDLGAMDIHRLIDILRERVEKKN
ncbi:MAG: threonine--tRNA ligase [Candidatus Eremiobacteraeota bacterium]|nr:threonine--tRNA ligase [Candidatus Eremiobacteraeota bacterium]